VHGFKRFSFQMTIFFPYLFFCKPYITNFSWPYKTSS
jgi:hypothetical protein